jgi:purine-nucleoside phosphorylase
VLWAFKGDIIRDTSFAYTDGDKAIWYPSLYGISSVIDSMALFLDSKKPNCVILIGSCGLNREIARKTLVIPRGATRETGVIRGNADEAMVRIASQIAQRNDFDTVITDKHVSKFSILRGLAETSGESEDLETASVYYLANSYGVPAVALLGVSDYRSGGYTVYVDYEEQLKDDVFALASRVIQEF